MRFGPGGRDPRREIAVRNFVGNTSVVGSHQILLSFDAMKKAEEIASKMTYIELSGDNTFFEQFTAATFLPHTDIELFPSVADKLRREPGAQNPLKGL